MADIVLNFAVKTLEGAQSDVVTLARSQVFTASDFSSAVLEQVAVPPNTTDMMVEIPTTPSKIVSIENPSATLLSVKFNLVDGTSFPIPAVTGFLAMSTTIAVSAIYITNATINPGKLVIFIGG
jgi:hypothetical protein